MYGKKKTCENRKGLLGSWQTRSQGVQISLVALLILTASAASAEIESDFTDDEHFMAWIFGMPDLDQQRQSPFWGEERDEGSSYCGPTAAANALSYLAREGHAGVDMSDTDLEPTDCNRLYTGTEWYLCNIANSLKRQAADVFIASLADEMNTHPIKGTSGSNMRKGTKAFLGANWTVRRIGDKGCHPGSTDTVSPRAIFDELDEGSLVILRFGFYEPTSGGKMKRTGGHWVTPTGIFRADDHRSLFWRDPARDDDTSSNQDPRTTQSQFVTESSRLENQIVHMKACSRSRWQVIDRSSSEDRETYIEDMIVITPPGT